MQIFTEPPLYFSDTLLVIVAALFTSIVSEGTNSLGKNYLLAINLKQIYISIFHNLKKL